MTCPHCEELKERIAWLEAELGVQTNQTQIRVMCSTFAMTQTEAWYALVLWKAKGRTVDRFWLLDNRPTLERNEDGDHLNVLRVYMSKLRTLLGPYVKSDWGKGYFLTPEGIELIDKTLSEGLQGENHANRSGRLHDKGVT